MSGYGFYVTVCCYKKDIFLCQVFTEASGRSEDILLCAFSSEINMICACKTGNNTA